MTDHIDFEAKTDRELIILTAQTCNNISSRIVNIDVLLLNHGKRITALETVNKVEWNNPMSKKKLYYTGSGIFVSGSLLGGMLYAFGQAMGWW